MRDKERVACVVVLIKAKWFDCGKHVIVTIRTGRMKNCRRLVVVGGVCNL
jgi:hypothetical protein